MVLRFLIFFASLLVTLALAGFYVHRASARLFGLGQRGKRVLGGVFVVATVLVAASRGLRSLPDGVGAALGVAGSLVMLAVIIAAVLLLLIALARLLLSLPARALRRASPPVPVPVPVPAPVPVPVPAPAPAPVSRREFISQAATGSALLIGAGSSVYGTLLGRHDYHVETISVVIPGLSRKLDGYTLLQLSDVHLGTFVGEPEMRAAEDLVRGLHADRIILTGDLVDSDPRYVPTLARFVRRLSAYSRDAIVAIPGNHDYFTGWSEIRPALEQAGAVVLVNDGRVIGDRSAGFALLGVDDLSRVRDGAGPDLDAAIARVPEELPRVLLCHNPKFFPSAAGRVALQLSGHTHGGQVNIGVNPARLVLGHPYIAGEYALGGTRLYVNRGFGTAGPPARVGAPPEVTRIVLVSG